MTTVHIKRRISELANEFMFEIVQRILLPYDDGDDKDDGNENDSDRKMCEQWM